MRDRILVGYIAAASGIVGYMLEKGIDTSPLVLIVPFLSLGAALTIAQHQDQIVAFNQYLTNELAHHLPSGPDRIKTFDESRASRQHLPHNLGMSFASQVTLLCVPPLFVVLRYFTSGSLLETSYAVAGVFLTAIAGGRLWMSYKYRKRVVEELLKQH